MRKVKVAAFSVSLDGYGPAVKQCECKRDSGNVICSFFEP